MAALKEFWHWKYILTEPWSACKCVILPLRLIGNIYFVMWPHFDQSCSCNLSMWDIKIIKTETFVFCQCNTFTSVWCGIILAIWYVWLEVGGDPVGLLYEDLHQLSDSLLYTHADFVQDDCILLTASLKVNRKLITHSSCMSMVITYGCNTSKYQTLRTVNQSLAVFQRPN